MLSLNVTYDGTRNSACLVLVYEADSNAFFGRVENNSQNSLSQVCVEVHLSNGIELSPTKPIDLGPGEVVKIELPATEESFDGWQAHVEVGEGKDGESGG